MKPISIVPMRLRPILLLGLVSIATFVLTIQLASRLYCQSGLNMLRSGDLIVAMKRLDTAARWMSWNGGRFLFRDDLRRIHVARGQAAHRHAVSSPLQYAATCLSQAVDSYRKALSIHPRDIEAVRGMARALAAWESLTQQMEGVPDIPEDPLPYFENLTRIRPNSISALYALAMYSHRKGLEKSIPEIIARIVSIYPPIYRNLTREPFYSEEFLPFVREGLTRALARGTDLRNVHDILSQILEKEDRIPDAIAHYQSALAIQPSQNVSAHYIRMGNLHLLNNDPDSAQGSFIQALSMTQDVKTILSRIYAVYQKSNRLPKFIEFSAAVEQVFPRFPERCIWTARAWLTLEKTDLARREIESLLEWSPTAEAHLLLAEIAAKDKDWDTMELAAQRAAILDDGDYRTWSTLIHALRQQGKLIQAEQAASQAISRSPQPNAWLYNSRAWLRWDMKIMDGALEDWRRAAEIMPTHADFHYRMARIYEIRKEWPQACASSQAALNLQPTAEHLRQMWQRVEQECHAP